VVRVLCVWLFDDLALVLVVVFDVDVPEVTVVVVVGEMVVEEPVATVLVPTSASAS
jgi:hypothetical protein